MASSGPGTQVDPVTGDEGGRPGRAALVFGAAVLLAMLGMWAWIFTYHISGSWRSETPGRMDDRVYGELAEQRCRETEEVLASLPQAFEAETAGERADGVALTNVELRALLDDLAVIPVATRHDQDMITEWLADWRQYVADREDYVVRLRQDPDARFYVTQSDRDEAQITVGVDRFAALNDMPACMTPQDLS